MDTWNKVTYDKYDPDLAKKQADMQKKEKHIDKEGKREKVDLKGGVEPKNSDKSGSSLGDIFGTGDDSGNRVDASKRFYESKTGFWTSLYHDSKGRTDVVSKKSTSTEFRLTDLGLDKKFALSDLSQKGDTPENTSLTSLWGGKSKDAGINATDTSAVSKPKGIAPTGGFRGFLVKASQDKFLSFTRDGTSEDAHSWWIENRKELTDEFRRKHRDALRRKRNSHR